MWMTGSQNEFIIECSPRDIRGSKRFYLGDMQFYLSMQAPGIAREGILFPMCQHCMYKWHIDRSRLEANMDTMTSRPSEIDRPIGSRVEHSMHYPNLWVLYLKKNNKLRVSKSRMKGVFFRQ